MKRVEFKGKPLHLSKGFQGSGKGRGKGSVEGRGIGNGDGRCSGAGDSSSSPNGGGFGEGKKRKPLTEYKVMNVIKFDSDRIDYGYGETGVHFDSYNVGYGEGTGHGIGSEFKFITNYEVKE